MTLGRLVDKKLHTYNPEEKVYVKGKYHKKKDIVSALHLEELVKASSTEGNPPIIAHFLQSLLEEAQK